MTSAKRLVILMNFFHCLHNPPTPYPPNYFENQNASKIRISAPPDTNDDSSLENSDYALRTCFPGSVTYRYGRPRKIVCGSLELGQSDTRRHTISEEPEFMMGDNPVFSVYKLKTTTNKKRDYVVCPICLSLQDSDEKCIHHSTKKYGRKPPYNQPILQNKVLEKKMDERVKKFRYPLKPNF